MGLRAKLLITLSGKSPWLSLWKVREHAQYFPFFIRRQNASVHANIQNFLDKLPVQLVMEMLLIAEDNDAAKPARNPNL